VTCAGSNASYFTAELNAAVDRMSAPAAADPGGLKLRVTGLAGLQI
jgi:hypothetical protein